MEMATFQPRNCLGGYFSTASILYFHLCNSLETFWKYCVLSPLLQCTSLDVVWPIKINFSTLFGSPTFDYKSLSESLKFLAENFWQILWNFTNKSDLILLLTWECLENGLFHHSNKTWFHEIIVFLILIWSWLYYFLLHRLLQVAAHALNARTSEGQAAMQSSRDPGHPSEPPAPFFV